MPYDCSRITERLYIGAQINDDADIRTIEQLGITSIIDAQMERDDRHLALDFEYMWNPTEDDGQHKEPHWFGSAIDFGLAQINKPGAVILTHCAAGINRGPSLGYAILRALGWPPQDAFDIIKKNRPQVQIAYKDDAEKALQHLGWTR